MNTSIKRETDGTIELTITIPWQKVSDTYNHVVDEAVKNVELTGFRKGKAPRNLVEDKLDKSKVYEDVIRELVPTYYNDALKEHNLHPVIMPKIELKDASEKKDWVINVYTCEKPEIKLEDYKDKIREAKATKHKKIWVPGQDSKSEKEEKIEKPSIDELINTLFTAVSATISHLIIEHEVNRMLSDLINQTKKLGLTVEQYLSSTHKTSESIRKEYEEDAKKTVTLEFALEEIADKEGILVSDDELDKSIQSAKTDEERKSLEKERYYLATILRRQKTLDFLASL